jgi:hypothetical protein
MDPWQLSQLEAAQGLPVAWGWALRRLPGAGLLCCIGIWHGTQAAND